MSIFQSAPGPSNYSQHLSPRERMRLAKAALMEDEDKEVEVSRERRKSRRASSFGINTGLEVPGVSRRSSIASIASMASLAESSSPTGSTRGKQPGRSILRSSFAHPTLLPDSTSSTSLDSYTALPPPISRFSATTAGTSCDFGPSSTGYDDSTPRAMRRRSSRVRFSDAPLPPAKPAAETLLAPPSPVKPIRADKYAMRRASSTEGLREDLIRTQRQLSYSVDPRASFASFSSVLSDPFGLSASPLSRLSSQDSLDFSPQPLPYPKMPQRPSRLSICSTGIISPSESDRGDSVSSSSSPSTPLRDVLNRSSLGVGPSPRTSGAFSYTTSIRDSLASISSTMLSASEVSSDGSSPIRGLPSGSAYSTLLPSLKNAVDPDRIPKFNRDQWKDADLGLSPRSGPSPAIHQDHTFPESLPLPRLALEAVSLGSPIVIPKSASDGLISPLEMPNPFDSVDQETPDIKDSLPAAELDVVREIEAAAAVPATLPCRAAHLDSIDLLPITSRYEAPLHKSQTSRHSRSDSINDEIVSFPLPPSRQVQTLEVSFPVSEADTFARNSIAAERDSGLPVIAEINLDTPRPDFSMSTFSAPPEIVSPPATPHLSRATSLSGDPVLAKSTTDTKPSNISAQTLDAAVDSGILSPNSRLLNRFSSPKRPALKRAVSDSATITQSGGWSGDESEEEEFVNAIRAITLRKLNGSRSRPTMTRSATSSSTCLRKPTINHLTPTSAPMLSKAMHDRFSSLSNTSSTSGLSSADSTGPLTPGVSEMPPSIAPLQMKRSSSSSSGSTVPGDFPWGGSAPSSPTGSIKSGKTGHGEQTPKTFYEGLEDLNRSLQSVKHRQSCSYLPEPRRKIRGWGKPEVLVDENRSRRDKTSLWGSPAITPSDVGDFDSVGSLSPAYTPSNATPLMSGGTTPRGRMMSPPLGMSVGLALGMEIGVSEPAWGSLLEEDMDMGLDECDEATLGLAL